MAFRMTSNVRIEKDKAGITRQLKHPRQPFTARSISTMGATQSRRLVADQYLNEVLAAYNLAPEMVSDLDGAMGNQLQASEGSKLHFDKEKIVRNHTTVSYAQTYGGLPVWEAGMTVRMRDDQVIGSQSSLHHAIALDPPPENAPYRPDQMDPTVIPRRSARTARSLTTIRMA